MFGRKHYPILCNLIFFRYIYFHKHLLYLSHKSSFSSAVLNIKHFIYNFAADLTRLYKSVVCSYGTTNLCKSISNPFFLQTPNPPPYVVFSPSRSSLILAPCREASPSPFVALTSASTKKTLKASQWLDSPVSIRRRSTLSLRGNNYASWWIYPNIWAASTCTLLAKLRKSVCKVLDTLSANECFVFPRGDLGVYFN